MASSLTVDSYRGDINKINTIKQKTDNKDNEGKSFKELMAEKYLPGGKVNVKKLDTREKRLYQTCSDMESLLWKQVLNSMKKTIHKNKMIDGGQGEEIFRDFLYDEYSTMMSKHAGTGIADTMFKQLNV